MDVVERLTNKPEPCRRYSAEDDALRSEAAATITALRARVEELEGALGESYSTLAAAFNRVHCLPRTTDTDLANRIEVTRAKIDALRAKGGEHGG